jgi:hypothetical protein
MHKLDERSREDADYERFARAFDEFALHLTDLLLVEWVRLEGRDVDDLLEKMHARGVSIRTAVLVRRQQAEIMYISQLDPHWMPAKRPTSVHSGDSDDDGSEEEEFN